MMAITTISSMRVKAPPAPDDEARMSNVEGLINLEDRMRARFLSSFVIRISDFVIPAGGGVTFAVATR